MSEHDEIEDILTSFGVHEGFPDERMQMARKLALHGWTPADVADLCAAVERRPRVRNAAGAIARELADPEKGRRVLEDVRRCATAAAARQAPPDAEKRGTVADVVAEAETLGEESRRAVLRRVAFARVVQDRHRPDDIADEMGLPVATVRQLVEEQRAEIAS